MCFFCKNRQQMQELMTSSRWTIFNKEFKLQKSPLARTGKGREGKIRRSGLRGAVSLVTR
jgi:hypothetical protein